jgi:hypothetical protein
VVRQWSAKPLFSGSIPLHASKFERSENLPRQRRDSMRGSGGNRDGSFFLG